MHVIGITVWISNAQTAKQPSCVPCHIETVRITVPGDGAVNVFLYFPTCPLSCTADGGAGSHLSWTVKSPILTSSRAESECGTHCEKGWLFTRPTVCSTVLHSKIFTIKQQ